MSMLKHLLIAWFLVTPVSGLANSAADSLIDSMTAKNQATMDRLQQDEVQRLCSKSRAEEGGSDALAATREQAMKRIEYPIDGQYLGDWASGAKVASNGRGLQYSDDPEAPNGGNCYACHQLDPREVAFGTLGPSLTGYGARGQSEPVIKYTWVKLWNTHAYNICSHMPRFGAQGILTEQQLKDVMAYLLDPDSPVNQPIDVLNE